MSSTYLIIIITAGVSIMAFNNLELKYKLIFFPYKMNQEPNEWFRFISSGLIHADFTHLIFNLVTLFFFGPLAESGIKALGGAFPEVKFWLLYLGSMVMGSIFSYYKHQHNANYMAL
ncbi:MAG: rhomboid family intramembrane serine protease, partial [Bacteroidia bacterium]